MTPPQNLVAVTPGGAITDEQLAGYYVLYSIREEGVALSRARKAFRDHGLDVSRLPEERRPEHVMMDACSSAQRITQNGHREEIRAQMVGRNSEFVIYQMTRHVHDLQNRVIEHPKALRVVFRFRDGTLDFEPLDGAVTEDVQGLIDEIQNYYDSHQKRLPGRGLRTIVRHYIEAAGAMFIRDGAYFMPKMTRLTETSKLREHHGEQIDGRAFIDNLRSALRDIYGSEPELHAIPCVNDEGQREFLKRKFLENCADDLSEFRDECLKLVNGKADRARSIRTDLRTRLVSQRRQIDERRQQFSELLGETLEELDRNMLIADKALAKFLKEANA